MPLCLIFHKRASFKALEKTLEISKSMMGVVSTHKSMSQLQAVPATAASSEVAPVTRFLFFYSSARNGGETHRDPPEPCGG